MSPREPVLDPDLRETLEALELPPESLRSWFQDVQAFCQQHGGRPRYAQLMELMEECLEQLPCD